MQYILRYFQQAWRSKFARNVAIVASGTAAAQVITVAFSPIITRLYGPEAFGVLGTFNAVLAIMVPLAALSYPIAIVLPKEDHHARGLVKLSIILGVATSSVVLLLLALFQEIFLNIVNLDSIGNLIFLVPIAMFLSVLTAVCTQWVIRKKLFKLKAKITVWNALITNVAKSGIGLVTPASAVLLSVATAAKGLNALLFYRRLQDLNSAQNEEAVESRHSKESLKFLARKYDDFAYYRTPQIVINAASQGMPVLMLAAFFGTAVAGFYTISKMVLGLPSKLVGQAVANVFYPHFNETMLRGGKGSRLLIKATGALALVGVIPFGLVFLFGPFLFEIVFGSDWRTAGEFAQWLALWSFSAFMNRPSVGAIPVLKLQAFFLAFEIVSIILRVFSLALGYYIFGTALAAVVMFSLVSVGLNAFLILATALRVISFDHAKSR